MIRIQDPYVSDCSLVQQSKNTPCLTQRVSVAHSLTPLLCYIQYSSLLQTGQHRDIEILQGPDETSLRVPTGLAQLLVLQGSASPYTVLLASPQPIRLSNFRRTGWCIISIVREYRVSAGRVFVPTMFTGKGVSKSAAVLGVIRIPFHRNKDFMMQKLIRRMFAQEASGVSFF